jgi:hypothetical protein
MSRGRRGCNISEWPFPTGKRLSHFEALAKHWQRLVGKVRGRIVLLLCLFSNSRRQKAMDKKILMQAPPQWIDRRYAPRQKTYKAARIASAETAQ